VSHAPQTARPAVAPAARRVARAVLLLVLAAAVAGCGKKGPPRPPEPRGPYPPRGVVARQIGAGVEISFETPAARGKRPAQQPVTVELLRVEYVPGVTPAPDPDVFRRRGVIVATEEGGPLPAGERRKLADRSLDELPEGGEAYTMRYAVRIRDRRGRPSPLVVAPDLALLAPAPAPTGLEAEPTADGVRLVWEAPPGVGPFRYNVYRSLPDGDTNGVEAPLNPTPLTTAEYLDGTVEIGNRYRYFVRVSLADGRPFREGASGAAREVLAEDRFAPGRPQSLVAVQEGLAIRLFWDPNKERDLAGYRVYRRGGDAGDAWNRIGPDPVEQSLYLDREVRAGQGLEYRVSAVDRADPPNESGPSETVRVDVSPEPSGAAGGF